jgi:hypothetical protein
MSYFQGYKKVLANKEDAENEVRRILEEVDINKSGQIDFTGKKSFVPI